MAEETGGWWRTSEPMRRFEEETVLNVVCLALAVAFLVFAAVNVYLAGDFLTTDSLFMTAVLLLLAGIFAISPIKWMWTKGLIKVPFGKREEREEEAPVFVAEGPVHFEGGTRLFLGVLGWLLGLTLIEVFLAYIHLRLDLMLTILLGLSIIKAALIMAYFMHLRFERLSLVLTIVPAMVIFISLLLIFFPDSFRASKLRYRHATPAAESSP